MNACKLSGITPEEFLRRGVDLMLGFYGYPDTTLTPQHPLWPDFKRSLLSVVATKTSGLADFHIMCDGKLSATEMLVKGFPDTQVDLLNTLLYFRSNGVNCDCAVLKKPNKDWVYNSQYSMRKRKASHIKCIKDED